MGKRLGRQALAHVASVAKPETILAWYRKLIAQKFDGSKHRAYPGRPTVGLEVTDLIVRIGPNPSNRANAANASRHRGELTEMLSSADGGLPGH